MICSTGGHADADDMEIWTSSESEEEEEDDTKHMTPQQHIQEQDVMTQTWKQQLMKMVMNQWDYDGDVQGEKKKRRG